MKKKTAAALLIPIIALFGWVLSLEYHIATSQQIRVAIQGYDPRDILAGHYITFSLTTEPVNPCTTTPESQQNYCVCYSPAQDGISHTPTWGGLCDTKPSNCSVFVTGRCQWSRFTTDAERYSIPEYLAPALKVIPPGSSALLSVNNSGSMQVVQLYKDEMTIEEFAQNSLSDELMAPVAP